jgi:hypothetical protein
MSKDNMIQRVHELVSMQYTAIPEAGDRLISFSPSSYIMYIGIPTRKLEDNQNGKFLNAVHVCFCLRLVVVHYAGSRTECNDWRYAAFVSRTINF